MAVLKKYTDGKQRVYFGGTYNKFAKYMRSLYDTPYPGTNKNIPKSTYDEQAKFANGPFRITKDSKFKVARLGVMGNLFSFTDTTKGYQPINKVPISIDDINRVWVNKENKKSIDPFEHAEVKIK